METIKSAHLEFVEGNSAKEYNTFLVKSGDNYLVNALYGRIGNAVNTATKTNSPVDLETAEKLYNALLQEKMKKGYVLKKSTGAEQAPTVPNRVSTGLIPQLLNPIDAKECSDCIECDSFLAQEKFDGKRIIAQVKNGVVTTSNRQGLECGVPGETQSELSTLPDIILDGELIGNRYYVFDLLEYAGVNYKIETCKDRYKKLYTLFQSFNDMNQMQHLHLAPTVFTTEEKQQLFELLKIKEGIVFKHKDSKYVSGRPASMGNHLKFKNWDSATLKVIKINDKRSVGLGASDGTQIVFVGNCIVPANYNIPQVGDMVEIKYLYYYEGGALYQPQYLGERTDKNSPDNLSTLKRKSS